MTREQAQVIVDRSMAHEPKERPWSYKAVPVNPDDDSGGWTIETIDPDGVSLGTFVDIGRAARAIADRIRGTSSERAGDASLAERQTT